jgi:hypothetical protein
MIVKLTKMTPILFVGAVAAAISFASPAMADDPPPPPPPCLNADGTPCSDIGNVGPGGAEVNIPYGPSGTADGGGAAGEIPYGPGGSADGGGASGSLSPYGPGGSAGPGGAEGCIPNVGCINIPAP